MTISIDTEKKKTFNKIQHTFMIKLLKFEMNQANYLIFNGHTLLYKAYNMKVSLTYIVKWLSW